MIHVSLVGATGSGKSETGNFLIGRPAFKTSDRMISCTDHSRLEKSVSGRWQVFDNPGFSHHRLGEAEIRSQLVSCGFDLARDRNYAGKLLDAFVLVAKATPRLSTLLHDLQELTRNFGKDVLQSVVVLVINSGREICRPKFYEELEELTEVHKLFDAAGATLVAVPWDNLVPREGMEDELVQAIQSVLPYSAQTFFKSREEVHRSAVDGINRIYKSKAEKSAESTRAEIASIRKACDDLAESTGEPQRGIASWFFSPLSKEITAERDRETQKVVDFYEQRIDQLKAKHEKALREMRAAHGERLEEALQEIEKLRKICREKASDGASRDPEPLAVVVIRAIESLFNFGVRAFELWRDIKGMGWTK